MEAEFDGKRIGRSNEFYIVDNANPETMPRSPYRPWTKEIKGNKMYVVETGDTYEKIAEKMYGADYKSYSSVLKKENKISPKNLKAGQAIYIPDITVPGILDQYDFEDLEIAHKITKSEEGEPNDKPGVGVLKLHHPSSGSGVTIGYGYDMKSRKKKDVYQDLVNASVPEKTAEKMSGGAGLSGKAADKFISKWKALRITEPQADKLFSPTIADKHNDAIRYILEQENYNLPFAGNSLDVKIIEIIDDLHYRGDLKGKWNKIRSAVVANDVDAMAKIMAKQENWNSGNLSYKRYKARVEHLGGTPVAKKDWKGK